MFALLLLKGIDIVGVERVDYYSDEEYQHALQDEAQEAQWAAEQQQEPDVVPCFKCGCQMYEEDPDPRKNICSECVEKVD